MAAYLIYVEGENGQYAFPASDLNHSKYYDIIDQLSWPNNLNELKQMEMDELPEHVTSTVPGSERAYLEHMLRKENDNIRLLWVPTTLFQMTAVLSPDFWTRMDEDHTSDIDQIEIVKNRIGLVREAAIVDYFNLNKIILEYLPSHYLETLEKAIQKDKWPPYIELLEKIYTRISEFYLDSYKHMSFNDKKMKKIKTKPILNLNAQLRRKIFIIESMAYLHNEFPLYRSSTNTQYISNTTEISKEAIETFTLGTEEGSIITVDPTHPEKAFEISIANTLLAGWSDPMACTFYILNSTAQIRLGGKVNFYSLNVKKTQFLRDCKQYCPTR